MLFYGRLVGRIAPQKQQACVHGGMQRLHAAIEHLGKSRVIAQFDYGQARLAESAGGAAGGEQFHFRRDQRLRERNKSGLVENGDERALNPGHRCRLNSSRRFDRVNAKSAAWRIIWII